MAWLLLENKHKVLVIVISIIGLLLLGEFILSPVLAGYSTYQKVKNSDFSLEDYGKSVKNLENNLLVSSTNLSACIAYKKELSNKMDKNADRYSECKTSLGIFQLNNTIISESYKKSLENLNSEIQVKNKEIGGLKDEKDAAVNDVTIKKDKELNELKNKFETFAQNTANNLCCKAKVDNPKIKFYKIENNRIVCMDEGELPISC